MADMIIKPSSGNSLVFQDEGGDPALTVGTTGNTTLAGTANNLGTATAGTIGTEVTFPSGHTIVNKMIHYDKALAGHISTTSTSSTLRDSGIHGSFTPRKSSGAGGSWLLITFYTSFSQCQGNNIFMRCAMTSANDTSYDIDDMLFTDTYTHVQSNNDAFTHWWMFNSVSSGNQEANTPANLTSYTGGTTYHFRLWWSVSGGTGYLGHANGMNHLRIQEVMI